MRPDMRMFWIDPATGKMKVDHGFNVQGREEKYDTPAIYEDTQPEESDHDE